MSVVYIFLVGLSVQSNFYVTLVRRVRQYRLNLRCITGSAEGLIMSEAA